jgi:hypothetical protein
MYEHINNILRYLIKNLLDLLEWPGITCYKMIIFNAQKLKIFFYLTSQQNRINLFIYSVFCKTCMSFIMQPPAHTGSSLADFSTLKMEAIPFSETSAHIRSTRHHIPEDGILQFHSSP